MKGLSQAEQTPDFIVPNGLREPDLSANDQGVTSPNTFCAALGAWWMSIHLAGRSTGREWALLNWLLPLLLWSLGIGYLSPPFTVKFKWCHLFSPDSPACSKINGTQYGLHSCLCCQLGST